MRAVPRYPSNVYYNVSRQGQQLDEYNWIYVAPANGGGCVPITGRDDLPHDAGELGRVRDLRDARHVPPPDGQRPAAALLPPEQPRRLQPGAAGHRPGQGGILYPVIDALVDRYEAAFDRAGAPLVQLTSAQIAETLARQEAWAAARGRGHARGSRTAAYTYATAAPRR